MYRDTPYAEIPVYKSKPEQKTHVIYERWQGTVKLERMDEEQSRYKMIRAECIYCKKTKRKQMYPILRRAHRAFTRLPS